MAKTYAEASTTQCQCGGANDGSKELESKKVKSSLLKKKTWCPEGAAAIGAHTKQPDANATDSRLQEAEALLFLKRDYNYGSLCPKEGISRNVPSVDEADHLALAEVAKIASHRKRRAEVKKGALAQKLQKIMGGGVQDSKISESGNTTTKSTSNPSLLSQHKPNQLLLQHQQELALSKLKASAEDVAKSIPLTNPSRMNQEQLLAAQQQQFFGSRPTAVSLSPLPGLLLNRSMSQNENHLKMPPEDAPQSLLPKSRSCAPDVAALVSAGCRGIPQGLLEQLMQHSQSILESGRVGDELTPHDILAKKLANEAKKAALAEKLSFLMSGEKQLKEEFTKTGAIDLKSQEVMGKGYTLEHISSVPVTPSTSANPLSSYEALQALHQSLTASARLPEGLDEQIIRINAIDEERKRELEQKIRSYILGSSADLSQNIYSQSTSNVASAHALQHYLLDTIARKQQQRATLVSLLAQHNLGERNATLNSAPAALAHDALQRRLQIGEHTHTDSSQQDLWPGGLNIGSVSGNQQQMLHSELFVSNQKNSGHLELMGQIQEVDSVAIQQAMRVQASSRSSNSKANLLRRQQKVVDDDALKTAILNMEATLDNPRGRQYGLKE